LGIALQQNLIFLNLNFFFDIFYAKSIDPRHHAGYVTSHFLSLIKLTRIVYIFNVIMIKLDDYTIPSDQMMPDITRVG